MQINPIDINAFDEWTGKDEFHDVVTITLGELVESGVFDWNKPILEWENAAYDEAQYIRVCAYFIERFYYREISMLPFKQWANFLRRKLVYELMPKYNSLYGRIDEGIDPLQDGNEYYKERTIDSAYPETLLSENADYITEGKDTEHEKLVEGNLPDAIENFTAKYKSVDELLLDELEVMFISLYTVNVNGW